MPASLKTAGLANVASIIADGGRAAIVDPRRDLDEYLDVLKANDPSLTYVRENHRQEDFELGSVELKKITRATIDTGDHPLIAHCDIRLRDGEELELTGLFPRCACSSTR